MIADDAIRRAVFDHVIRHVALARIHKPGHESATAIEFSDRTEVVLIEEALDKGAVNSLGRL